MKKYILAALFCGTFTFCSCSGFLDEVPKGQITTESYYRTEQHAISATNAIYNYLTQLYTLMHQSHKIKAAPKFKLRCGFYLSIFNSYYLYHNFII